MRRDKASHLFTLQLLLEKKKKVGKKKGEKESGCKK